MKYGLIGEKLGHSFSPEIHGMLSDYTYELKELKRDELKYFLENEDFRGINVTIPYKEEVIPSLYYLDSQAEEIGAVNTVIRTEGHLFGFNTDIDGMIAMIEHAGIEISGKRVAILGTGGTSKTALAVAKKLGAGSTVRVSRAKSEGTLTYDELYEKSKEIEIIINTTPVGMYPGCDKTPLDLSGFTSLSGVVDVIYNPLRTRLVSDAQKRGIPATGGLYMLVGQAARASELFLNVKYAPDTVESVYERILRSKENIVLVGMPSSGKTTVGRLLKDALGFSLTDTDEEIVKRCGMDIPSIFATYGEEYFRNVEEEVIRDVSAESRQIISTGGGVILRQNNIDALKRTGKVVFLDRPLEKLIPTEDRPLALNRAAIEGLYEKRYPIYSSVCDMRIDADGTPEEISLEIIRRIKQ